VETLTHDSRLLADNPLGDPARRTIGVYLPPGYDGKRRFPTVTVLTGFTGTGMSLLNSTPWEPNLATRMDRLITDGKARPAILIMPDCFTRYGGSQYADSPALGRYQSYIVDEIVPAVEAQFRCIAAPEGRAVVGKSSGGHGALSLVMDRPGVFSAAGSHAGDAAFATSYSRDFPSVLLQLEKRGGIAGFLTWFEAQVTKPSSSIEVMSHLCCAAAWSPTTGPYGFGQGFELPFKPHTGELVPEVFARWLAFDPVERVADPAVQGHLGALRALYLDAGRSDEYFLQLGARQLSARLTAANIPHLYEEFDGGHRGIQHRYDRSLAVLTEALARA